MKLLDIGTLLLRDRRTGRKGNQQRNRTEAKFVYDHKILVHELQIGKSEETNTGITQRRGVKLR